MNQVPLHRGGVLNLEGNPFSVYSMYKGKAQKLWIVKQVWAQQEKK